MEAGTGSDGAPGGTCARPAAGDAAASAFTRVGRRRRAAAALAGYCLSADSVDRQGQALPRAIQSIYVGLDPFRSGAEALHLPTGVTALTLLTGTPRGQGGTSTPCAVCLSGRPSPFDLPPRPLKQPPPTLPKSPSSTPLPLLTPPSKITHPPSPPERLPLLSPTPTPLTPMPPSSPPTSTSRTPLPDPSLLAGAESGRHMPSLLCL